MLQIVHYRYRGPELLDHNMDEYAALICVIEKKVDSVADKPFFSIQIILLSNRTFSSCVPNLMFRYLSEVHRNCQGQDQSIWRRRGSSKHVDLHDTSSFYWDLGESAKANQLPGSLTWIDLCRFVSELRDGKDGTGQTFKGQITLAMFNRITQGLKTTSNDLAAAQDYRCRESSILNRPDITSALQE